MIYKGVELDEYESMIIELFTTNPLGREGMAPLDAMSSEGQTALRSLIDKGFVEEAPYSELTRLCAGTRYLLVDEKYPMTKAEFFEYRDSGKSEEVSYSEFLALKESGEWKSDKEEVNAFVDEVQKEFETITGSEMLQYLCVLPSLNTMQDSFRAGKTAREAIVDVLIDDHNMDYQYEEGTLSQMALDSGKEDFVNLMTEVHETKLEKLLAIKEARGL